MYFRWIKNLSLSSQLDQMLNLLRNKEGSKISRIDFAHSRNPRLLEAPDFWQPGLLEALIFEDLDFWRSGLLETRTIGDPDFCKPGLLETWTFGNPDF